MQCFWGESAFAKLKGVRKTRVGYAGGTTINPNYGNIGDHTEVTEVQFDPNMMSYEKSKYGDIETYVVKLDKFYPAENYHQKYWLRNQKDIFNELKLNDSEVANSVLAAKMNAYCAGYSDFSELEELKKEHGLSDDLVNRIKTFAASGGDPRACH
ncbi:hypothetical protein KIN20_010568 [Parelaphostrongylus tenuis]|uniref:peptide-methionine (S)-S-oxide reductase n=1 Tax=Parelaphostrongylus tenuis TaxID=148309 RepID=A0AAD5MBQ2_PARTN|nr:hypothetical protein KIN20_010568 [Parelaphostrongylus tenuis]